MHNPRFDLLMLEYSRQGSITLTLFGITLVAIFIGWVMLQLGVPAWLRNLYFGLLLIIFILILAGITYIIRGGTL
jgi:hypothetical protein